jgi:hypothetical protein
MMQYIAAPLGHFIPFRNALNSDVSHPIPPMMMTVEGQIESIAFKSTHVEVAILRA